jgi:hypothetical protein
MCLHFCSLFKREKNAKKQIYKSRLLQWGSVRTRGEIVCPLKSRLTIRGQWGGKIKFITFINYTGHDSSVGIATRCGLDGPGIESQWVARFSAPVQTGSEAHPVFYTMGTGSLPGVKRPRRGVDHPPLSSTEVKERVQLCLYTPYGASWPVLWWTLPFINFNWSVIILNSAVFTVFILFSFWKYSELRTYTL